MNCSVNLLPVAMVHARNRLDRGRAWAVACGTALVAIVAVWTVRWVNDQIELRLLDHARAIARESADKTREIVLCRARAGESAARLVRLDMHSQRCRWPERYEQLAATAPAGVVLAELAVRPSTDVDPAAAVAKASSPLSPNAAPKQVEPPRRTQQRFRVVGYAADHAQIAGLINALSALPGCSDIQLVSAVNDPRFPEYSVRFECTGVSEEATP